MDIRTVQLSSWRIPLMLAGCLVVLAGGVYFVLTAGEHVATDDAYIQTGRVSVSAEVSGRVVEIDVRDNQPVKAGQVLFKLDDQPFRIAVAEANAARAAAVLKVQTEKADYRETEAQLRGALATEALREREFHRQTQLLAAGATSQTQYDQTKHDLAVAHQASAAARQQLAGLLSDLAGDAQIPPERHPTVQQAQAALDRAQLDLSYAVVTAPKDGIVTKVDQLQIGDRVTAGTAVFSLMATGDVWIEANFKETDLTNMAAGLPAKVAIDTYPGRTFSARVVSFSPGTGSAFALLPPENATGNWVKVVQRLPVRLAIDPGERIPLHSGLSATVEVRTRYSNPVLKFFRTLLACGDGS